MKVASGTKREGRGEQAGSVREELHLSTYNMCID
jgi:hypothetical protein